MLGDFVLPQSEWMEHYYGPLRERAAVLRAGGADAALRAVLDENDAEIELYETWGRYYGYAFFVARAL